MRFVADIHIHSRFSRATSRDLDLEHLELWAMRKGVTVVGTGDFTYPAWFSEIKDRLEPAEPGLFRLKADRSSSGSFGHADDSWTPASHLPVRFMLSVEISNIYKKGGRVRKVHNLILAPDMESAEKINLALERIGNIRSDGRPILGLDSKDLLEIVLESSEGSFLIPAHIWTPWFSMLGSKSGFDSVEECFEDLAPHIFALETGLSSDPAMNWRLSSLDRYALVSNSDAHSAPNLAREANVFNTDLSFFAIRKALESRDPERYLGTIEFFPQEGKYHFDGHRKCNMCLSPRETRKRGGLCPVCDKPVTVGVMHRIEELADRDLGIKPSGAPDYRSLIPLPEIISEIVQVGKASKKVMGEYIRLLERLGPELAILERMPIEDIAAESELVAEAIRRMRVGKVIIKEGYDGEYGTITLFEKGELKSLSSQMMLFAGKSRPAKEEKKGSERIIPESTPGTPGHLDQENPHHPSPSSFSKVSPQASASPLMAGLNPEQVQAVKAERGPIMIVAGPGAGKTRTLTHRIAYLILEKGVRPEKTLAITFTNKAKDEMAERLRVLITEPEAYSVITIKTFHSLGLLIIREEAEGLGLPPNPVILSEDQRLEVLSEITGTRSRMNLRPALTQVSNAKQMLILPDDLPEGPRKEEWESEGSGEFAAFYRAYQESLKKNHALDFDDLILVPVRLFKANEAIRRRWQARFDSISIDEYQDLNHAQYELVKLISRSGENLCVIGDPDQSIYGFRGSEVKYFFSFSKDYPGSKIFHLEKNYRSSECILKASQQVIIHLSNPERPRFFSDVPGPKLALAELASERAEAEFVVHQIEQMVGGTGFFSLDSGRVDSREDAGGMSFSEFAVLYRMDALSKPFLEAFERSGIPFQKVGDAPLASEDVKPLLAVLGFLMMPDCEITARGALEFLLAKEGPEAFQKFSAFCRKQNLPLWEGLKKRHRELAGHLQNLKSQIGKTLIADLIDGVLDLPHFPLPKSDSLIAARKFLQKAGGPFRLNMDQFLESMALASPQDFYDERADRVALLTLHAAKGLEFDAVFIIGCEQGIIPYLSGERSQKEIEEERRVFYVGMTRARRWLYLTRAKKRALFGPVKERSPSPFLQDIQEELTRRAALPSRKAPKAEAQLKLF